MAMIVLLPMPHGAISVMLWIRMQSGRDLGKHLKNKSQPKAQHFNRSITTRPSSQYSTNVTGFTGTFPTSGTVNQIQQVDTSIMVATEYGAGYESVGCTIFYAKN
jgi:hypothetical protein